jgi:hypothetical protein
VALNPQPLPPREAFLIAAARAVIRRAELLQEIAGALFDEGSERGIIIVGGYTSRFSDDWCGTGFSCGGLSRGHAQTGLPMSWMESTCSWWQHSSNKRRKRRTARNCAIT